MCLNFVIFDFAKLIVKIFSMEIKGNLISMIIFGQNPEQIFKKSKKQIYQNRILLIFKEAVAKH